MLIILLASHVSCFYHLAHVWIVQLVFCHIHYSHSLLPLFAICTCTLGQISGLFFYSLKYCSNKTILLWHGLNILLHTDNIPFAVLHFSFSSFVKVFTSYKPILHSQFFVTRTFSSPFNSYVFVVRMFMISILKLSNSTYLTGIPVEWRVL